MPLRRLAPSSIQGGMQHPEVAVAEGVGERWAVVLDEIDLSDGPVVEGIRFTNYLCSDIQWYSALLFL